MSGNLESTDGQNKTNNAICVIFRTVCKIDTSDRLRGLRPLFLFLEKTIYI